MSIEEAIHILESSGLRLKERKRLPNDTGYQIQFEGGEIVNFFDSGKFNVQGKNAISVKQMLEDGLSTATSAVHPRTVFVVYGQ